MEESDAAPDADRDRRGDRERRDDRRGRRWGHGVDFARSSCSLAALAIWIAYGLVNATVMRSADAPDGLQWTGLQGIGAAIGSILLLPLGSFGLVETASASEVASFVAWALVMGLAGSWFAT